MARVAERLVYLDCPAGAGGDMLLATLLDLGDARQVVRSLCAGLRLPASSIALRRVAAGPVSAVRCRLRVPAAHAHSLAPLIARAQRARLPATVRRQAVAVLRALAAAERHVHRGTRHARHVHEVGRLDTLIVAAGCALALEQLRVRRVYVGPIPLGHGAIRAVEGWLPNPGPAVLELLRGLPVYATSHRQELVTPTAAALLRTLARPAADGPAFTIQRVGYGVGSRRIAGRPGMVRACLAIRGRAGRRSHRT